MRLISLAMTGATGSAPAIDCVAWVLNVEGIGPLAIDGVGAEKTDSTVARLGIVAAKVVALKANAVVTLPPPLGTSGMPGRSGICGVGKLTDFCATTAASAPLSAQCL